MRLLEVPDVEHGSEAEDGGEGAGFSSCLACGLSVALPWNLPVDNSQNRTTKVKNPDVCCVQNDAADPSQLYT
jgi:hypothetical protein